VARGTDRPISAQNFGAMGRCWPAKIGKAAEPTHRHAPKRRPGAVSALTQQFPQPETDMPSATRLASGECGFDPGALWPATLGFAEPDFPSDFSGRLATVRALRVATSSYWKRPDWVNSRNVERAHLPRDSRFKQGSRFAGSL